MAYGLPIAPPGVPGLRRPRGLPFRLVVFASLLIALLAASAAGLRVVSSPGGVDASGDTLHLSLSPGDTAWLDDPSGRTLAGRRGGIPGTFVDGRLRIAPDREGSWVFRVGPRFRRSRVVRLDVLPSRTLRSGIVQAGGLPMEDAARARVRAEVNRLLAPLRTSVDLPDEGVLALPGGARPWWDREGDGHLDLRRNMDSTRPHPELDSLARWVRDRGAVWPAVVVVSLPTRTGWELGRNLVPADTVLFLARGANLPWRDERGALRTYVVSGRKGERADTFQVLSYGDGAHRVRWVGPASRARSAHPAASDWVTLPGFDPGAYGFTPWWLPGAPVLVFPAASGRLSERALARILAREIARGLGLEPDPDGRNLMCPMVRPDVSDPLLRPDQWRRAGAPRGR